MTAMQYRPWGQFHWLLDQYQPVVPQWDLLGCLSPEDRCLTVRNVLFSRRGLGQSYLAQIKDADSIYTEATNELLETRKGELISSGGTPTDVRPHDLFESPENLITAIGAFIGESTGNIIVDISALPKRFFFMMIKELLKSPQTRNIIATYTIPAKYRIGEMAEDFEPWRPLPMFGEQGLDTRVKEFFVGVGHITMGLPELFEALAGELNVHIFIPFPGHPQSIKRNWQFVRTIEKALPQRNIIRRTIIHARNVSESFDHILAKTNNGQEETLFAPYGPKPLSLAMCLYSCITGNSSVYYTQPKIYPPDYSIGVETIDGIPRIYGYCIRIEGKDLYSIKAP